MSGLVTGKQIQGTENLRSTCEIETATSSSTQTEEMPSSALNLSLTLLCLAGAVGVISCGRSHMVLNSALENSHGAVGEEIPERLTIPELQWMISNAELPPIQVDDSSRTRMELVRRDSVTAKPVNCMNYFWKSRTAC